MVNKNNIEEKLFDYFEGELTSSESTELEQFIDANPEFKTDFDAWEKSYLPQEEFTYDRASELLVDEKTGKSVLFGRWKTGLLMLLVGTGLSFGLFQKLNGGQNVNTAGTDVKKELDKKVVSNTASNKELKEGLTNEASNQSNTNSLDSEKKRTASNTRSNLNVVSNAPKSAVAVSNNVAQTGGRVGTVAPRYTPSANQNISSSNNVSNTNGQGGSKLHKMLARNSKFKSIEIGLETNNISELLSTPKIKKSRSKFEKYDKNELKFQNEKDPFFALPNGMALGMNPSFAGNGKGIRLNYNYNYHWPELNDNYNTHMVSLDTYVKALRGGVGVVLISDVLGHNKFSTKGAEFIYSPKFTLYGKTTIEPSLKYGHYQKSVAWAQIKGEQLVDNRTGTLDVIVKDVNNEQTSSSTTYSNLGFGLLLNTSKLFVGFAYDHLLGANYDFDGISENITIPGKLTAHVGGSIIPVKDLDFLILSPSLHFVKVGGFDKVWLSNVVEVSRLFVGTSYSFNNEYLFSLGYDNDILRVSYSYGKTKSMLNQAAKNLSLHQVGLTFSFIQRNR